MNRRRWLQAMALGTVVTGGAAALARCSTDDSSLSAEGLPRYAYRSETALTSYRFAAAQPDLLAKLPCYCGCGQQPEFQNLRDCFRDAAGRFNSHGANCQTCIDEALDAKRLLAEGRPVVEIRRAIDTAYRGRGKPTNTPPVE